MTNSPTPTSNNQQNLTDKQKQDAKNNNAVKPDAEKDANGANAQADKAAASK